MKYVEIKNLSFSYSDSKLVLNNISIDVEKKGLYILMGENGSGKTTLLKILVKFLWGYSGSIKIKGKNLSDLTLKEVSREIAFLESEIPEIPLRVGEILSWGRFPYGDENFLHRDVISKFGLNKFMNKEFLTLSTGERKRVLLGRIFVQDADIVLIDEPFNFLDPRYKIEIALMLKELSVKRAVFITTHDLNAARFLGGKVFLLKNGELRSIISKEEFFFNDVLMDVFSISEDMKKEFLRFYGIE